MRNSINASLLALASIAGTATPFGSRYFKFTPTMMVDMSGSLGGTTFAKARGGQQYGRARVTPTNPNTSMQKAARDAIQSASAYWKNTLSDTERESWWDQATGGQTGQGIFTRVNQPRIFALNTARVTYQESAVSPLQVIQDPTLLPDFSPSTAFTAPTNIVIDDSANTINITGFSLTDPWNADSTDDAGGCGIVYVYVSHQQSASRLSRQHPYQLIRAVAFGAPNDDLVTPIDLAAAGFTTETGKVMYVKLRAQHKNGGISTDYVRRVTITA